MQITNTKNVAIATKKSERTIQHWEQIGKLPAGLPIQKRTVWPLETIREWLIVNMPDADFSALNTN